MLSVPFLGKVCQLVCIFLADRRIILLRALRADTSRIGQRWQARTLSRGLGSKMRTYCKDVLVKQLQRANLATVHHLGEVQ